MGVPVDLLSIGYGLGSASAWGAGDFSGGLASKKVDPFTVVFFSQLASLPLLLALIVWMNRPVPAVESLLFGAVAGAFGSLGLVAFYKGLAVGRMGLVAPLGAMVTAAIPVVYTMCFQGLPYLSQGCGFILAGVAIWLLTATGGRASLSRRELSLALSAGLGFGLFFIFIHYAGTDAVLWPLVTARAASLSLVATVLLGRKRLQAPSLRYLPIIALAGVLDVLGNACFILAAQYGRLDVSVVISSLSPGATVLLAWLFLKERLTRQQWLGVVSALVALDLIAL